PPRGSTTCPPTRHRSTCNPAPPWRRRSPCSIRACSPPTRRQSRPPEPPRRPSPRAPPTMPTTTTRRTTTDGHPIRPDLPRHRQGGDTRNLHRSDGLSWRLEDQDPEPHRLHEGARLP